MWKPHVPFIMFYSRILRRAKPCLSVAGKSNGPTDRVHRRETFFLSLLLSEHSLTCRRVDFRYGAPLWVSHISKVTRSYFLSRHGLVTPSVGFHQIPVRSSPGKQHQSIIPPPSFRFRWEGGVRVQQWWSPLWLHSPKHWLVWQNQGKKQYTIFVYLTPTKYCSTLQANLLSKKKTF